MENAVEALKIAFAVMMFIVALTLSISSFSQATTAVKSITAMSDKQLPENASYVTPSAGFTRTVGIETVIPTMYRAYKENIEIYFFKENGDPLPLYYKTDNVGNREQENYLDIEVNYVDLKLENFGTSEEAAEHLDIILFGKAHENSAKYTNQFIYDDGLYDELSQYTFEENLGEYYVGTGNSKIKKRVITYQIKN